MSSKCFVASGATTGAEFNLFDWTPSNNLSTIYEGHSILAVPCSLFTFNFRIH